MDAQQDIYRGVNSTEKVILHVDMDAYFASIEEKSNPMLRDKPVIVSGSPETRTTVSTANYKAREYGIKSGMPLGQALRLCPGAEIVVGNSSKYLSTTSRLLDIFREFTPRVECYSIDEAFLDITGSMELFGGAMPAARKLKDRVREILGLTCSVGIAPNRLLAKLASDSSKPDGLTLIERKDIPGLMEKLPVEKLCGIGEKLTARLNGMGINTCGDLAAYPEERLARIFGVNGRILKSMGRGDFSSHVNFFSQQDEYKSMGHSFTLYRDTVSPLLVRATLCRLCEQVGRRMRKAGYRGKSVTIMLRFSDFRTLIRQKSFRNHTDDGKEIYRVALSLVETFSEEKPVRLLGVSVSSLIRGISQPPLFKNEIKRMLILSASDRINDKYGEFTLSSGLAFMEKHMSGRRSGCHGSIMKREEKKDAGR